MNAQTISQVLVIITGALCLFIAAQLGRRTIEREDDRLAWNAFRVWWLGLGLSTANGAVRTFLALQGVDILGVYVWISILNILLICFALWGLLFYLLYLYTGNRKLAKPLGVFYALFFAVLLIYSFGFLQPTGVVVEGGTATIEYATEPAVIYQIVLGLLVLLPQLLASLVYFSFYFRVRERVQKYRILMVSVSILVWFGLPLVAFFLGLSSQDWWTITNRIIAMLAVIAIYWAYYPPKFIQQQLQVVSI